MGDYIDSPCTKKIAFLIYQSTHRIIMIKSEQILQVKAMIFLIEFIRAAV